MQQESINIRQQKEKNSKALAKLSGTFAKISKKTVKSFA